MSNETVFQHVIPTLQQNLETVSAYVGVGPDQNFTYIAALKPRIAFIVDIRRQNMMLHLMYKALIEMSPTRAEFLSPFSRPMPSRTTVHDSPNVLLDAFHELEPDPVALQRNRAEITHGCSATMASCCRAPISRGSITSITRSIARGGLTLLVQPRRRMAAVPDVSRPDGGRRRPGETRSYIASEEICSTLRDMQERNLIVPLVGDFAGQALRSVARYLEVHHATVSVFYTSNVEQYLFRPADAWQRFTDNVGALPITGRSRTFIRAFFNNQGRVRAFRIRRRTA